MGKNVYELVTEKIISQLEAGIIPWQKPWTGLCSGAFNRITRKPYSFLNQMLLQNDGEYATFKQWQQFGGHVRKGEKSEMVVFWKIQPFQDTDKEGNKIVKNIPILRYYNVFHISQVEGVEPMEKPELNQIEPITHAEKIIADYIGREGISFENMASNRAYYSPKLDLIHLPLIEQFGNSEEYYSTAFHESVHSTGHATRLKRFGENDKNAKFESETYSKEELVAEIGASNLLNICGIETNKTFKNNVAYIQNWLKVLKNDTKFIVLAASRAEKSVKFILGECETE